MSAAIAAAFISAPTFAQINVTDDTGALAYAKEALLTTDEIGTTGYYAVSDAGTDLNVEAELGFGVSAADQVWVRVELTNAVFTADLLDTDLDLGGGVSDIEIAQGGLEEGSFVVYAITTDANYAQDALVTLALTSLGIKANAPVSVTYSLYESGSGAAAGGATDRLATASYASAITVGNALVVEFTPEDATADVETSFLEFTAANGTLTANLGTVEVSADTDFLAVNSDPVTLADILDDATSTVSPAGNFSFGLDGGATFYFDADAACDSQDFLVLDVNDEVVDQALADVNGAALCVDVTGDEADAYSIPESTYTAGLDFEPVADAVYPVTTATGAFGSIDRNGTVVEVPFLSTYAPYNQRLVMVNRGSSSAAYSITFTEEAGNVATGLTAATGTLAPMETKIIKATDVVSLTGATRTAATITVVAPENEIDVATTILNNDTGSADVTVHN
ncbi:hypothetical protein [Cellvibrio sp. UBA7671]|uniref:hypothetical protein n=1 Tax=Cellvibrio sp. UBA7671 TaxID=1946312 RepID=UPI002F359096